MPGTLTRWYPFAEFSELRSRFDRMFDELSDGRERAWTPAIDVVRESGNLVVRADIPGIKPEEVKIEVEDDILTVSTEHEESKERRTRTTCGASAATGPAAARWRSRPASRRRASRPKAHDGVVEATIPLPQEAKETVTITPTAA